MPTLVSLSWTSILITGPLSYLCRIESRPKPLTLRRQPGPHFLLAGMPNTQTFPSTSLSFKAKSPLENDQDVTLILDQEDLAEGLQHSAMAGLPRRLDWLKGLQHGGRTDEGWDDWIPRSNFPGEFFHTTLSIVNVLIGYHPDGESRRLFSS